MIKIENVDVVGWEHAIRGMRNPKNSWDESDSVWCDPNGCGCCKYEGVKCEVVEQDPELDFAIGQKDLHLMQTLADAGTDHGKFLRMITVYADVTAPLYWWKEADTYRMGVEKNSCSTMHKIHAKPFTLDDFSREHLWGDSEDYDVDEPVGILNIVIGALNDYRDMYLETKDKLFWWQMIQLLPSSYNQRRTVMMSYAALKNMYHARKNHKLDEWREFCRWIESLPYSELITGGKS